MNNWEALQQKLIEFRNDRDWEQFHNPKGLALAISIEAAQLNELFLLRVPESLKASDLSD